MTQSDGTDQSDGTSLIVALMQSSASGALLRSSMLMLENASRSYRCTCLAHACTAFSLFTHRSSRLQLSLASVHPRSGRSTLENVFGVHRCSSYRMNALYIHCSRKIVRIFPFTVSLRSEGRFESHIDQDQRLYRAAFHSIHYSHDP